MILQGLTQDDAEFAYRHGLVTIEQYAQLTMQAHSNAMRVLRKKETSDQKAFAARSQRILCALKEIDE